MAGIIRRLRRLAQSIIGIDLLEEEPASSASSVIDNLKNILSEIRVAAVRVIASQYRIERLLRTEEEKLVEIDAEISQAEGNDELLRSLQSRKDLCKGRIEDLKIQLEQAKIKSSEARRQIDEYEEELQKMMDEVHDAQIRYQLASLKAQTERFSFTGSLDEDLMTIERIKEQADIAQAEADAVAELKDALGLTDA